MCASNVTTGSTTPSSDRMVWYLSECKHNHFNHSRVKKGKAWLCCRDCGTKWRTPHPLHSLCPEFYETRGLCALGSSCPYLHVHRFKCTERSPTHVAYVGEDRDDLLRECAIAVLTACLPEQPFPRDVMPQIRALYEARRGEMNIPPANRARFSAVETPVANAIAVEDVHDQQITEVNRIPTPPMPAKMITPALLSPPLGAHAAADAKSATGSVSGLSPVTLPAQQQLLGNGGESSSETAVPLLPVTGRYVPVQRTLHEGRRSSSGHSLDSEDDKPEDGSDAP